MTEYIKRVCETEESSRVQITDVVSVQKSFYDDDGIETNVVEIGCFGLYEISLNKDETLKLIESLQKLVKEL